MLYLITASIVLSVFFLIPQEDNDFPIVRLIIIIFASVLLIKYFIYMFISPWHDVVLAKNEHRQKKFKTKYEPKVSILVPAWNEGEGVVTTVEALLKSSYQNMEILVIDNASTDHTTQNIKSIIKNNTSAIELIYLKEGKQGKGYALNKGIEVAKGEILISIDADCFVPSETIQNFVNHFRDPKVMAAVGNVKIGSTDTIFEVIQYLEFLFSFYFKKSDSLLGSIYIIGGAAGAFRKKVFEKLGGYSVTNITEDIDLSFRIQYSGMKIIYAENAVVYTEGAPDFPGLIKQRLRWKRGRLETFLKYRHMFFSTQKKHNKILSWIILPLAIFGDMQLFFELFFIVFLYIFSYLTNDYSSFISGIIVVVSTFAIQIIFDPYRKKWGRLILLAPIGWLLLYASTFVELNALVKTFWGYARSEELKWQVWERKGVFAKQESPVTKE